MNIEYKQWDFITNYLTIFIENALSLDSKEKRREGKKIIQRWLMSVNQAGIVEKYEYYPLLPKVVIIEGRPLNEVVRSLVEAIEEKLFFGNDDQRPTLAVKDILEYIETCHNEYDSESLNLNILVDNETVSIGKFRKKRFINLPYLLRNIGEGSWNERDVLTMILRYESVGNYCFQYAQPKEVHKCYYHDHDVRYEGFASPLNSSLMDLPGGRFCSLFPDTDSVFGSMGNFFDIDLLQYPGGWSVNPPFIETILNQAADKVIEALEEGVKINFFCTYPLWEDNNGWIQLSQSKHNIRSFNIKKNVVLQEENGKMFSAPFGLSIFCLSYCKEIDLEHLDIILHKNVNDFESERV